MAEKSPKILPQTDDTKERHEHFNSDNLLNADINVKGKDTTCSNDTEIDQIDGKSSKNEVKKNNEEFLRIMNK